MSSFHFTHEKKYKSHQKGKHQTKLVKQDRGQRVRESGGHSGRAWPLASVPSHSPDSLTSLESAILCETCCFLLYFAFVLLGVKFKAFILNYVPTWCFVLFKFWNRILLNYPSRTQTCAGVKVCSTILVTLLCLQTEVRHKHQEWDRGKRAAALWAQSCSTLYDIFFKSKQICKLRSISWWVPPAWLLPQAFKKPQP